MKVLITSLPQSWDPQPRALGLKFRFFCFWVMSGSVEDPAVKSEAL